MANWHDNCYVDGRVDAALTSSKGTLKWFIRALNLELIMFNNDFRDFVIF